ncbi:g1972 [Coccomyxa elongata]
MKTITSVQQFVDELAAAGDKLVIVDFYAKWCNACRALFPKLCQICTENPDIVLLKVDFDENRDTVKPLGIKVLPFFHFYRGSEGRVAAFSASVGKIQRLRDALAEHSTPRCSLGTALSFPDFPDITPRTLYGNNVVLRHSVPSMERDVEREAREPAPV